VCCPRRIGLADDASNVEREREREREMTLHERPWLTVRWVWYTFFFLDCWPPPLGASFLLPFSPILEFEELKGLSFDGERKVCWAQCA
jgi:hypothetical protein